jgi:hypothetical protein
LTALPAKAILVRQSDDLTLFPRAGPSTAPVGC